MLISLENYKSLVQMLNVLQKKSQLIKLRKLILPRKIKQSNYHKFVKQINTHILSVYLFFYGKNTLLGVNFVLKYVHVHTYTWRRESMKQTKWKKYIVYIAFSLFMIVFIPTIVVDFAKENGVHQESNKTEENENKEEAEHAYFG